MASVIAEPCIGVKGTACVDACPAGCIRPRKDGPGLDAAAQACIDPVECIDCGACVPGFLHLPGRRAAGKPGRLPEGERRLPRAVKEAWRRS